LDLTTNKTRIFEESGMATNDEEWLKNPKTKNRHIPSPLY